MNADLKQWNGLRRPEPTLPSHYYLDAAHFELELQKIWYRDWIYLCRSEALPGPRSFGTFSLGTQTILLVRDDAGVLRAFHNTCRHRGAALCSAETGRFAAAAITCRYHAFSYGLDGKFLRRPMHGREIPDIDQDLSLYAVQLREWNGFVFVNLAAAPARDPEHYFHADAAALQNWPLAGLRIAHSQDRTVQCNWKILWENYNECLHCPGVHPNLSRLVPIYRRGIMEPKDDANWSEHAGRAEPEFRGGLRAGAASWTSDGNPHGMPFAGLSARERELGYQYLSFTPSIYLVAHVDYVRVVRYLPLGPAQTRVSAQWLVAPESLTQPGFDIQPAVEFVTQVMSEDAAVCELVQQGLGCQAHQAGVLMPEEYDVYKFQDWVRSELAR